MVDNSVKKHYHNHDQHTWSNEQLSNHVLREQLNRVCKIARARQWEVWHSSRWMCNISDPHLLDFVTARVLPWETHCLRPHALCMQMVMCHSTYFECVCTHPSQKWIQSWHWRQMTHMPTACDVWQTLAFCNMTTMQMRMECMTNDWGRSRKRVPSRH